MAAGDGLISMKPTSITHSGTSASINSDGGVDFSGVTSLSLNGVFTGDYDNYLVVMNHSGSANFGILYRLRSGGSDASGSDYANQVLNVTGTSVTGARATSQSNGLFGYTSSSQRSGDTVAIYGPYLAQPTASRNVNVNGTSSAELRDRACTHSLSTSYDGITLFSASNNVTGTVHVFGYEE